MDKQAKNEIRETLKHFEVKEYEQEFCLEELILIFNRYRSRSVKLTKERRLIESKIREGKP